jgi:hypothetical protein
MEDRPPARDRLSFAEEGLDREKITIAQHRLQWRHIRVGAQRDDFIKLRLLGDLGPRRSRMTVKRSRWKSGAVTGR